MTPSKNRSWGSPEFQISKFFDFFGHFEPAIADFVKNLWREMTPSQIWILGSEHGLRHGHSWASMSKHRLSTSKHEQILGNFPILGVWSQISLILWRIYEGNWHTPKSGFWGVRTARARPFTGKHEQAEAEHEQARANFGIFRFWVLRARYHRFCEEFIKENYAFQK